MDIQTVYFLGSFPTESKCPVDGKPEFAFIGRSNVGKSSLINMLCNHKDLAKVSGTPGKTRQINYFVINDEWYLVDLPGYGFARASKKAKANYERMIEQYLLQRETLMCAMVLLDSRHDLQDIDREFINWLGSMHIPFVLVFTKLDKLKEAAIETNIQKIKDQLLESWHSLPDSFASSAKKKKGRDKILNFIESTIINYKERLKE